MMLSSYNHRRLCGLRSRTSFRLSSAVRCVYSKGNYHGMRIKESCFTAAGGERLSLLITDVSIF